MDNRIERAATLLHRYRQQYTTEPLCSTPEYRAYRADINEAIQAMEDAGRELSAFILRDEVAGRPAPPKR